MTAPAEGTQLAKIMETNRQAVTASLDLILIKGLYTHIEATGELGEAVEQKLRKGGIGTFDCYCITCRKETPFIISTIDLKHEGGGLRAGNALLHPPSAFALRSVCQRDLTSYIYVFHKVGNNVVKIGQHPSMADIAFGELKGLDKTLDPIDRKELGAAIGLFAHEVASGAFVYLRRVFERMIRRAHDRYAERNGQIPGFDGMRVDEKIAALKDELPERAVRNKAVFSVLSAGIHELTDEQCMALFPVLKAVIFQMLEQDEHKRKEAIAERETDAAFRALLSDGTSTMGGPVVEAEPQA